MENWTEEQKVIIQELEELIGLPKTDEELKEFAYGGLISLEQSKDNNPGTNLFIHIVKTIDKQIILDAIDVELVRELLNYK